MAKAQEGRGAPPPAAAGPTENAKKYAWPSKPAVLSTRVKRLDGPDKVTGRAKYAEDYRIDGMLFAKLLLSPMPHARVRRIDTSRALARGESPRTRCGGHGRGSGRAGCRSRGLAPQLRLSSLRNPRWRSDLFACAAERGER